VKRGRDNETELSNITLLKSDFNKTQPTNNENLKTIPLEKTNETLISNVSLDSKNTKNTLVSNTKSKEILGLGLGINKNNNVDIEKSNPSSLDNHKTNS